VSRIARMLVIGLLLASSQARAAATCSASATTLAFGSYSPLSLTPLDSTGDITVTCSLGGVVSLLVTYTIKLSTGSGTYAARRLGSGGNTLAYNLYTTLLHTTAWGDGSGGSGTVSDFYLLGVGTTARTYTVYGRIPAQQNARGGSYSDSITVTVDY
jgi:spore coat protein U-like protein